MKLKKLLILFAFLLFISALAVTAVVPLPFLEKVGWLPWGKHVILGLDLQGGVHVVLEAKGTPKDPVTPEKIDRAMAVIENRVNQFGVAEPVIQKQGEDRIIVELAGNLDPERVVRELIKPAYLEFKDEEGNVIVTGADLKDAIEARDPTSGMVEVDLTFNKEGASKFAEATARNVGRHIGIYLDGKLVQNPRVEEPIPNGKARITGYQSLEEAHTVAVLLRSGALPVRLEVMEMRGVGPQLGQDSLSKSIKAGIVGLVAILVFMIMYYRVPGVIANLALIFYALLVFAVFIGLHATMTLPGIAGFLLSLGMAVDANVIIFERIKEELRSGKLVHSAIDAGFKRGFVAVFDANLTTLIAAVVLYFFGQGPIKGFAVTLSIGIVASMFTAVSLTRWMLHLLAGSGLVKNARYYGA